MKDELHDDKCLDDAIRRTGNEVKDKIGRRMTSGHSMDSVVRTSHERTEQLIYLKLMARGKRLHALSLARPGATTLVSPHGFRESTSGHHDDNATHLNWEKNPYQTGMLWCAGQDVELRQATRRALKEAREKRERILNEDIVRRRTTTGRLARIKVCLDTVRP